MKKLIPTLLLLLSTTLIMGQSENKELNHELVTLARVYRNFHFTTAPSADAISQLSTIQSAALWRSAQFISECIKTNNQLATKPYLTKPDSATLKYLFIIREVNWNLHEAEPKDNIGLVDSLVKPPNYKAALEVIAHYPSYNGQPYYEFQDLNFADFNLTLDKRNPKESFKKYYLNKYLNTLLYHSYCLGQKNKYKEAQQKVMLHSILRNDAYYKYSDHPEVFRSIFQKVNQ
jgi:hypothetical protein